jgi:hypothetical protein
MSTPLSNAIARIVAADPRADGGQRQIFIAANEIAIDRRVAGVRMRLSLPIRAFRGVSLALMQGARGSFFRVALDHCDPDLRVTLAESQSENDIAPEWHAWAQFFQLPRVTHGPGGDLIQFDRRLGALTLGAVQPRKRGWPLKLRRSRMSGRRKPGPKGRVMAIFRGEREIICYE